MIDQIYSWGGTHTISLLSLSISKEGEDLRKNWTMSHGWASFGQAFLYLGMADFNAPPMSITAVRGRNQPFTCWRDIVQHTQRCDDWSKV